MHLNKGKEKVLSPSSYVDNYVVALILATVSDAKIENL